MNKDEIKEALMYAPLQKNKLTPITIKIPTDTATKTIVMMWARDFSASGWREIIRREISNNQCSLFSLFKWNMEVHLEEHRALNIKGRKQEMKHLSLICILAEEAQYKVSREKDGDVFNTLTAHTPD